MSFKEHRKMPRRSICGKCGAIMIEENPYRSYCPNDDRKSKQQIEESSYDSDFSVEKMK